MPPLLCVQLPPLSPWNAVPLSPRSSPVHLAPCMTRAWGGSAPFHLVAKVLPVHQPFSLKSSSSLSVQPHHHPRSTLGPWHLAKLHYNMCFQLNVQLCLLSWTGGSVVEYSFLCAAVLRALCGAGPRTCLGITLQMSPTLSHSVRPTEVLSEG